MKGNPYLRMMLLTVSFWTTIHPVLAHEDQREATLLVGEKDILTLESEVKAGDLILHRGRYRVGHRVEGSIHTMSFDLLSSPYRLPNGFSGGEVACILVPLKTKASRTKIFTISEAFSDRESRIFFERITRIEVKGENVAHLFPRKRDLNGDPESSARQRRDRTSPVRTRCVPIPTGLSG
jgi:hypothetical protein